MGVESDADRLNLLNDFGETVEYNGNYLKGIFENPHQEIGIGEMDFSMQEANVVMRSIDASYIAQDDTVTINKVEYLITDLQPDGTGFTTLMLEKQ